MEQLTGFYIHGTMAGYSSTSRTYNGKEIVNHEIGVQVERVNQFGMTETETVVIRLPQSLVNPTMIGQYQGMAGKEVAVPVWVGAFSGRNGPNYQLNLDSKKAIELIKSGSVKAVGAA